MRHAHLNSSVSSASSADQLVEVLILGCFNVDLLGHGTISDHPISGSADGVVRRSGVGFNWLRYREVLGHAPSQKPRGPALRSKSALVIPPRLRAYHSDPSRECNSVRYHEPMLHNAAKHLTPDQVYTRLQHGGLPATQTGISAKWYRFAVRVEHEQAVDATETQVLQAMLHRVPSE